jgi:hypothetical protein
MGFFVAATKASYKVEAEEYRDKARLAREV